MPYDDWPWLKIIMCKLPPWIGIQRWVLCFMKFYLRNWWAFRGSLWVWYGVGWGNPGCESATTDFFFGLATAPAHVEDNLNDSWVEFAQNSVNFLMRLPNLWCSEFSQLTRIIITCMFVWHASNVFWAILNKLSVTHWSQLKDKSYNWWLVATGVCTILTVMLACWWY